MPRVLLLFYEPLPAGQSTHVVSLVRGLNQKNYQFTVVLPGHLETSISALREAGARVVPLPLRKLLWPPQAVVAVARLIRGGCFDLVHIHSQEAGIPGRLVARLAGARAILYTPQTIDVRRTRLHPLYIWVERSLARFTGVIISVNELDRQRLIGWGIPPGKVVTIPNGIDLSRFGDRPADPAALRRALGLDPGRPLVMQVARLAAQKAPLAFVEGAWHVARERPDAQFVLLGDGPLMGAVAARISELGLEQHVSLLGHRAQAWQLMPAADVLTLTSRWEGTPYTLLEAMAAARPVVATAVNGCVEIIADGVNGFLVPPGNPQAWAACVARLLQDPVKAAEMGQAGTQLVKERYTLERMLALVETVYRPFLSSQHNR